MLYNRSNTEIVSVLALFWFSFPFIRLIPSTIRVMNSSHSIGYGEATLDIVIKETSSSDPIFKKNSSEVKFGKDETLLNVDIKMMLVISMKGQMSLL